MRRCFELVTALLVAASGHEGRKGPAGAQRVLNPEVQVSLSANGEVQEDTRKGVMRRDNSLLNMGEFQHDNEEGDPMESVQKQSESDSEDPPAPDSCDSGGFSTPDSPVTFEIPPPKQVPFTISFQTAWFGDDPPNMVPNPVCVLCWTINPDTSPSSSKSQFFRGVDGQPPRIAIMRMGNVLAYEEFSADGKEGTANAFASETKLNDGDNHEVVLVRGTEKITMWIDGKPDAFVKKGSSSFQNEELPKGSPSTLFGKAATTNEYLRRQASNTVSYNKKDPYHGHWALSGDVTNVRFFTQELTASQFPDSKVACEKTTTTEAYSCHQTCGTCNGRTDEDCLSCKGARFLHGKTCVEECPDGKFGNNEGNKCEVCDDACATCSGAEAKDCQTCATNYFLHKGMCVTSCPANHYGDMDSTCRPLAGSVIALKTTGLGETHLIVSNATDCVQLVPLEESERKDPSTIEDEAKMWMVSSSGGEKATFRNVKTGMALYMPSQKVKSDECASDVSSCAVARPPKPVYGEKSLWTDNEWSSHKCDKSAFTISALGNSQIALELETRYLQFVKGMVVFSLTTTTPEDRKIATNERFEPLIVMPAVKSEVKKSGRCASLITQALQCSAAAGGQGLDDFADFTEQGTDTKRPPGCYYYHDEITAPQSKGYQELPVKVMRVALNLLSDGAQADYSRFADFSAKTPCLCKVV